MPLIIVYMENSPKAVDIFKVTHIDYLSVAAQKKHKSTYTPQCSRCMAFGHNNNYCRSNWVFAYCNQNYTIKDCLLKSPKRPILNAVTEAALTKRHHC